MESLVDPKAHAGVHELCVHGSVYQVEFFLGNSHSSPL
jgi:hypothetical protein